MSALRGKIQHDRRKTEPSKIQRELQRSPTEKSSKTNVRNAEDNSQVLADCRNTKNTYAYNRKQMRKKKREK